MLMLTLLLMLMLLLHCYRYRRKSSCQQRQAREESEERAPRGRRRESKGSLLALARAAAAAGRKSRGRATTRAPPATALMPKLLRFSQAPAPALVRLRRPSLDASSTPTRASPAASPRERTSLAEGTALSEGAECSICSLFFSFVWERIDEMKFTLRLPVIPETKTASSLSLSQLSSTAFSF